MSGHLPPKHISSTFVLQDYETTSEDIVMQINSLNNNHKKQIDELKTQIDKLSNLVSELQKIILSVNNQNTEMSNGIQRIEENIQLT